LGVDARIHRTTNTGVKTALPRPLCFIASAFGKKDVDEIYNKAIKQVLGELRIRAARVDRIEHNDDIDDKIMALIQQCDMCIADLTYARPSVYYEAGVVHGLDRPVVYIARSDHFRDKDSDPLGNLRIHFDLQMKNVISWNGPSQTFRKLLRKRLKNVIQPVIRSREKKRALTEQRGAFKNMPVFHQLAWIRRMAVQLLRSRGFRAEQQPRNREMRGVSETAFRSMRRTTAAAEENLHMYTFDRLTSARLNEWSRWSILARSADDRTKQHYFVYLAVSLRRISEATFRSALPLFTPVAPYPLNRSEPTELTRGIPHTVFFSLVQNVQSIPELRQSIRELLLWLDANKSRYHRVE
jgi:hypothetical protein